MKKTFIFAVAVFCLFYLCRCDKNIKYDGEYIVTIVDEDVVEGKESMDSFYRRTKKGEKLKIIFHRSYTDSKTNYSTYIIYDGKYYRTNEKVEKNCHRESKFKYLNYSETDGNGKHIVKTEAYCLSNDENMTYETIQNSWLSSFSNDKIFDSIPIYCIYYNIDLCFYNNEVESIVYNSREYDAHSFIRFATIEMIDCLSWDTEPLENYGNNNWILRLDMNRAILNDANDWFLGEKNSTIHAEYLFDFEKKIAVMHSQSLSSLNDRLYANLTDEWIEKISDLFDISQGELESN